MASDVIALVLASALLHAVWNALLKREADPEIAGVVILGVAALASALLSQLAPGRAFPAPAGLAWSLAAGVCEGGYFATLAYGLRRASLGVVYTVSRGGAVVLVWPASALLLGERVTAAGAAGAALVVTGLALVGLDRAGRAAPRGVLAAALCAACIAGYHLCFKRALAAEAQPAAVFAAALAVALPLGLARLGARAREVPAALRARPLVLLGAGAICSASFVVFLSALARGGAGAVLTLRNTSIVFAVSLAWMLGERPGRPQLVGTALVAAGAVAMGWRG